MKLFFKLNRNVETVNNVSVDDKCFPVIGGVHPYTASSPLTCESALWFKTLAVDAIYVDCDRCLIFWCSVQNDVGQDVLLRKQEHSKLSFGDLLIPGIAKPLFEDTTLFDFDASLKEMMGKCKEVAEKLTKKAVTSAYINSKVANLLHVYILPSINFSKDDLYALSRARCLIEERRLRADSEIENKAQGKHLLEVSLENLKDNLIHSYDFESETYLRTCDPMFLKVFLKKVEEDSKNLNLNLEAQQSKVNWAKEHPKDYKPDELKALQTIRDQVHVEVEKLIKVRESLRNVVSRKEKYKRKKSKKTRPQHIESCYQNVFVEINRRWELDEKYINQLINDSVNISGAREATLSAILELDESNRNSDRSTRFEPGDFGDCSIKGVDRTEKSGSWLTLQERVTNILQDADSKSYKLFKEGCTIITSQIDLALSEFHLANTDKNVPAIANDFVQLNLNDNTVDMRRRNVGPIPQEILVRRSGCIMEEKISDSDKYCMTNDHLDGKNIKYATMTHRQWDGAQKFLASPGSQSERNTMAMERHDAHFSSLRRSKDSSYESISDSVEFSETALGSAWTMESASQLSLRDLAQAIENLKITIREHFGDIIRCLENELEAPEDAVIVEMYIDSRELIWKAYERHFSEKVLSSLTELYKTSLMHSISNTYDRVFNTSMPDLLEGDKILTLFFNNNMHSLSSLYIDENNDAVDSFSMARTVSNFSVNIIDCSISDLYALANADSNDVFKRFQFRDESSSVISSTSSSSSESGASVKTSDLFDDEELEDPEYVSPSCERSSDFETKSKEVSSVTPKEASVERSNSEAESKSSCSDSASRRQQSFCKDVISSKRALELLDNVLSPFKKQMEKCIRVNGILDKVRYLSKAIERLNQDVSKLYGGDHQSACDDIITMLILALSNMPKDIFIGLYVNLSLLVDILPKFLNGSLCEYNLVSLVASYDYLKNRNASQQIVRRDSTDYGK